MTEPTETPAAPSPVAKPAAQKKQEEVKPLRTTWQSGVFYDPDSELTVTPHGVLKDDEPYNPNAGEIDALKEKARASRIRLVEGDDD